MTYPWPGMNPWLENAALIELLSYSNKVPGRDREAYLAKREELLRTSVGFVELDLLRAGQPMPLTEAAASSPSSRGCTPSASASASPPSPCPCCPMIPSREWTWAVSSRPSTSGRATTW